MTQMALHLVDPTIPGQSGRDPIRHGIDAVQSVSRSRGAPRGWRWDLALRRALDRLDTRLLRDLGDDRDANGMAAGKGRTA